MVEMDPRQTLRRRWVAIFGVALLVGSPTAAVLLAILGPAYGLAEAPPSALVTGRTVDRLSLAYEGGGPVGLAYASPGRAFIPLGFHGIMVLNTATRGEMTLLEVCPAQAQVWSSGTSDQLFVVCWGGPNDTLLELNASTLEVTENLTLGSALYPEEFALDPDHDRLFLAGSDSRLQIFDLSAGRRLADVSIPGGWGDALYFDPTADRLIVGDRENSTLLTLDPSAGTILSSQVVGGNPISIAGDPTTGRLYVGLQDPAEMTSWVQVLNESTFTALMQTAPGPGVLAFAYVDHARGEVYFWGDGGPVQVLKESDDRLEASTLSLPQGLVAYDPSNDTFLEADRCNGFSGYQCVSFVAVMRSTVPAPPFSAVPVATTSTPLYLGMIGFVIGALLGMLLWVQANRRDLSAPLGEAESGPSLEVDPTRAEAAQDRPLGPVRKP